MSINLHIIPTLNWDLIITKLHSLKLPPNLALYFLAPVIALTRVLIHRLRLRVSTFLSFEFVIFSYVRFVNRSTFGIFRFLFSKLQVLKSINWFKPAIICFTVYTFSIPLLFCNKYDHDSTWVFQVLFSAIFST